MGRGALIPALALGAALLAVPATEGAPQRSPERGRADDGRSIRGRQRGPSYRQGQARHSDRRGDSGVRRGHRPPTYRHGRPYEGPRYSRYRPYYRPSYRPYSRPYYRPYPRPYYRPYSRPYPAPYYGAYPAYPPSYYPAPPPYGPGPGYRGGVHGSVAIGLPFFGLSLYF